MLVTFNTDVGVITMFGEDALAILKMMGHTATVPGAILAADVPAALSRLKAAVGAEKSPAPVAEEEEEEPSVSMAHRASPLIDLLTAAAKEGCDVMWE
ncbi:DUF1840 domain-containing protein [Nitrosomonas sp.]|uniref:DUF1840 domain-containing protein n=1 Tax=Nitrosomonas sp. TaxID=42353 RepID=UPI0025ECB163|nr:DUF1840 domain-containing protein [Nitrosomonas sp.]